MSPADMDRWQNVCSVDDLVEGAGVCALLSGRQIAVFQVEGQVYALRDTSARVRVGAAPV